MRLFALVQKSYSLFLLTTVAISAELVKKFLFLSLFSAIVEFAVKAQALSAKFLVEVLERTAAYARVITLSAHPAGLIIISKSY